MRLLGFPVMAVCGVLAAMADAGQAPSLVQKGDATAVLAATRTALGGEARIGAVKTFIANGRTRQVRGENLVPIEFEVQSELPDKYARRDEFPAQDQGPTTTGFNGDTLILVPRPAPPPPRPGAPAQTPAQQEAALRGRLNTAKQDFARLMLGMFATSFPSFPLTFTYVAQAEAPQGKADVIDVKGPGNFAARFFVNSQTHLPIMLTWQAPQGPPGGGGRGPQAGPPPPPPPGAPPPAAPAGGPPPGAPAGGAPTLPPPVEQRMYFADYRNVDGLQLPFRIRRAAGAETTEETTFDRFRVNTKVDPRRFESQ
ncbi:MAG: hypothetical protein ACRD2N_04380 [Vicinamibacterales bacterium]